MFEKKEDQKKIFYIIISIVVIAIVLLIIYYAYSNMNKKDPMDELISIINKKYDIKSR